VGDSAGTTGRRLLGAVALLGEQHAAGLLVMAQPRVVPGELLIRLRRVTGRADREVQPVKRSRAGRQVRSP
jgi:hypothetical protein